MLWPERFSEQGIVVQIDHAGAEIIAGMPVAIDFTKFFV
jgi:hypothetical protein